MDEATWLSCSDPTPMLEFLRGKASERKLRLFACACAWRVCFSEQDRQSYYCNAVAVSEAFADDNATAQDLSAAVDVSGPGEYAMPLNIPSVTAPRGYEYDAAKEAIVEAIDSSSLHVDSVSGFWRSTREREQAVLARLLGDIFGNPFRSVAVDDAWRTWNDGTVVKLAQAIYDERQLPSGHLDTGRLAILADALEDAGCQNADILDHCRKDQVHVRGCWLLDVILAKS